MESKDIMPGGCYQGPESSGLLARFWQWLKCLLSGAKVDKPKIRRNALCPCGSGKKYKHCCGTKYEAKYQEELLQKLGDRLQRQGQFGRSRGSMFFDRAWQWKYERDKGRPPGL